MDNRELDALVAEKVMGWEWWIHIESDARFIALGGGWVSHLHPKKASGKEPVDWDVINRACDLPRYSTDISAAWQVVENVERRFAAVQVIWEGPIYGARCIIRDEDGGAYSTEADKRAKTVPLAICLAALKALGVDPEKA